MDKNVPEKWFDQKLLEALMLDYKSAESESVLYEFVRDDLESKADTGKQDIYRLIRSSKEKDISVCFWTMVELLTIEQKNSKHGVFYGGFFSKTDHEPLLSSFTLKLKRIHENIINKKKYLFSNDYDVEEFYKKEKLKEYLTKLWSMYKKADKNTKLSFNKELIKYKDAVLNMYTRMLDSYIGYHIDQFFYDYGFRRKGGELIFKALPRVHSISVKLLRICHDKKDRFPEVFEGDYIDPKEIGRQKWLKLYEMFASEEYKDFDFSNIYMPLVVSEEGGVILCVFGNERFINASVAVEKELKTQEAPLSFMLAIISYDGYMEYATYTTKSSYYSKYDMYDDAKKNDYNQDKDFVVENLDLNKNYESNAISKGPSLVYDLFYYYFQLCIAEEKMDRQNSDNGSVLGEYVFSPEVLKTQTSL